MSRLPWCLAVALLIPLAGCGPTILEKRIIEQPDPALLRPGPSPEEESGEVPMLEDIRPTLTLVPADHDAPKAPDDPRPLALRDAPKTAPPLPPPPSGSGAAPPAVGDADQGGRDARDEAEDERDAPDEADVEEDSAEDDDEDRGPRRGGIRVNPR